MKIQAFQEDEEKIPPRIICPQAGKNNMTENDEVDI